MPYDDMMYPGVGVEEDEDELARKNALGGVPGVTGTLPAPSAAAPGGITTPTNVVGPRTNMPGGPDSYAAPTPPSAASGMPSAPTEFAPPETAGNVGAPALNTGPSYRTAFESTVGRRPRITDPEYQPAELHGWKKGLGALFTGMAAMSPNDPQAGARVSHELFDMPLERSQHQFELASKDYDTRVQEELREETEQREERAERSKSELEHAQAGQMDMVAVAVPGQTEPVMVQKKDVARVIQGFAANASRERVGAGHDTTQSNIAGAKIKSAEEIARDNRLSRERIARGHDLTSKEVAKIRADMANDPNKLTNTMKTMKQQAQATLPRIEKALDETQQVADLLGPGEGRWNEFWQGTIGVEDPRFAHYKDEIAFVSTAVTLAHARGRMSNELFEHFQHMFNVGRQAPENMIQALTVAQEWLTDYANLGNDTTTPAAAEAALPDNLPDVRTGGRNGGPIPDGVFFNPTGKQRLAVVKGGQWHTIPKTKTNP